MGDEGDEEEEEGIGGGLSDDDDDAVSMVVRFCRACSSNRLKFFFSLSLSLSLSMCVRACATDRVVLFRLFCFREYNRRATVRTRRLFRREEKDSVTRATGTPMSIASKGACLKAPKKRRTLTRKNTPRRKNGIKS